MSFIVRNSRDAHDREHRMQCYSMRGPASGARYNCRWSQSVVAKEPKRAPSDRTTRHDDASFDPATMHGTRAAPTSNQSGTSGHAQSTQRLHTPLHRRLARCGTVTGWRSLTCSSSGDSSCSCPKREQTKSNLQRQRNRIAVPREWCSFIWRS